MSEPSDMLSVNTQIRQLQEENQQLKHRVAYVSPLRLKVVHSESMQMQN